MVQINFANKEVNCKIVYYGPGRSGKTTNIEVVHASEGARRKVLPVEDDDIGRGPWFEDAAIEF